MKPKGDIGSKTILKNCFALFIVSVYFNGSDNLIKTPLLFLKWHRG